MRVNTYLSLNQLRHTFSRGLENFFLNQEQLFSIFFPFEKNKFFNCHIFEMVEIFLYFKFKVKYLFGRQGSIVINPIFSICQSLYFIFIKCPRFLKCKTKTDHAMVILKKETDQSINKIRDDLQSLYLYHH